MVQRRAGLSVAQQALALSSRYSDGSVWLKAGRLVWTAKVMPSAISRTYTLKMFYKQDSLPEMRVVDPVVTTASGEFPPHTYSNGSLCLYTDNEWDHGMFIADTIVPWAVEWLFYFEIWKATDVWCGDGPDDQSSGREQLSLHDENRSTRRRNARCRARINSLQIAGNSMMPTPAASIGKNGAVVPSTALLQPV